VGAGVMSVEARSPAASVGVEDLLIDLDDIPLTGVDALQRLLDASRIGRTLTLRLLRRGRRLRIAAVPADSAPRHD
jgi:S1-C subfamily serine protease